MSPAHHSLDYVELPVADLAVSKAFYTAAFGWQFTDYGPGYAGFQRVGGPGEAGGLSVVEGYRGPEQGPLTILYSADLEASLEAVVAAGGEITAPIFSFPGGRRFELRDPSGNALAVRSTP